MIIKDELELTQLIKKEYSILVENENNIEKKDYDNDILLAIQNYIYNNPNNINVIKLKKYLAECYYSFFDNDKLNNAFNISDDYYYQKKQEIFRYLPFNLNNTDYPEFFYRILSYTSDKYGTISNNFYPTLFEFFKEQNITMKNIYLENNIMNFINNNKMLMYSPSDYYGYGKTISEEEYWYNVFLNKLYKKKIVPNINQSYEDALKEYENKLIGNIGEFYINNLLNNKLVNPYLSNIDFVAKELGNGFGYDIYFQYVNKDFIKEYLIEVKTTFSKNMNNDSFNLTENESNIMKEAMIKNTEYRVYRVYKDNNGYNHHRLMFNKEGNFVEIDNKDIIYRFDHINDKNQKVFVRK